MKNISCILIFVIFVLNGCAQSSVNDFYPSAQVIDNYLGKQIIEVQSYLKIKNAALGRDFMFYGSFIPMLKSPTGHSLRGRIINFHVYSDRVVMLESPRGLSIAQKNESVILLAEFPIVAREDDGFVIDFSQGMKNAFTTRNVHSNELNSTNSDASEQFSSVVLTISFIKNIEAVDDVLTISQIAQWRNNNAELVSAEFRYFLREYHPSETFKKKEFEKNRHVLYFSTPPLIEAPTTETFAYVAKWELARPIIFHLSKNTPSDYIEAITDGILYWNHMFGKEILQVEVLKDDISAPHHRLNIVQWVPWDNEASAYADMVVDHLTGETVQAQVYVRSGWVKKSIKKMRENLQELLLQDGGRKLAAAEEAAPLPAMFSYEESCIKTLDSIESMADLIENIDSSGASEQALKYLTADVLRTVVAHEIGHVLGLRHNLAASTDGNISLKERQKLLRAYLNDAMPPLGEHKYLTKSVMDVFAASDDALIGSQIRALIQSDISKSSLAAIYTYDKEAIAYGYFNRPMPGKTPFCSDSDLATFLDCRRWDFSNTPLLFNATALGNTMNRIAFALADTFLDAIKPERKGGPIPLKDVPLQPQGVLTATQESLKELYSWFHQNARSVQVEANFAAYGPQNKDRINTARFDWMRAQIEQDGIGKTIFATLPPFNTTEQEIPALVKKFKAQFLALIEDEKQKSPSFSINPQELAQAEEIAFNLFSALNQDIIRLSALLVGTMQFDDPNYQLPIEAALGTIAKELILARKDALMPSDKKELPNFTYDLKTRDAATSLLRPGLGLLPDWSLENLQKITNELKLLMRTYASDDSQKSINLVDLDRTKRSWMIQQNQILTSLSKASSMVRALNSQISPAATSQPNQSP